MSYQELQEWVYGKKTIDFGLLKRHTIYAPGFAEAQAQAIAWFWEVLNEMNQEDRRKFVRFCYAQSTLPSDEEFDRK